MFVSKENEKISVNKYSHLSLKLLFDILSMAANSELHFRSSFETCERDSDSALETTTGYKNSYIENVKKDIFSLLK